jgi:hypothetical protein
VGDCCNGLTHETCDTGELCCGTQGCKNILDDESHCGGCNRPCTGTTDTCDAGVCKCGTGAPCLNGLTCSNGDCICAGGKFACGGEECTDCAPPGSDSTNFSAHQRSDGVTVQALDASCCVDQNDPDGPGYCSCGGAGKCCKDTCFQRVFTDGTLGGEFCCVPPIGVFCQEDLGGNLKTELCCGCDPNQQEQCTEAIVCPSCLGPDQPGRIGSVRRPR